ncbi:MAG: hypothetical protein KI793_31460 [Rivularia sp. (in: Bacteria)]|nr:hypothetical protein [Rivularia sp. MS3]
MHPLKNCLQGQNFLDSIPVLIDNLASYLDIPKEQLNKTLESLEQIDRLVRRKGRRKFLKPKLFSALLAYVGEAINQEINSCWELKLYKLDGDEILEPWIIAPNGNAITLHNSIYEQLDEGRTCYIWVAADTAIRRLRDESSIASNSVNNSEPNFSILYINQSPKNEAYSGYDIPYNLPKVAYERFNEWLIDTIVYYREFDFFQEYKSFSKEQISANIEIITEKFQQTFKNEDNLIEIMWEFYPEALNEEFIPERLYLDAYLLRWDRNRTWSEIEINNINSINQKYVQVLKRWSKISRGVFNPKNVKATWDNNTNLIALYFTINGLKHTIKAEYYENLIDLEILNDINNLIASNYALRYKFEICEVLEQMLVFVLTEEEKQTIMQERNISF